MKKHLVVFSGAGVSAESGLPTYRDYHGLWKDEKLCELMSAGGYYENPQAVLDVLNEMRLLCHLAQPNEAHKKIAELEYICDVTVITQNVDNLHERAGSSNVLHLHGKLSEVTSSDNRCNKNCIKEYPMDKLIRLGDKANDGSQLRPNVILFGEYLTEYTKAVEIIKTADIFLIIGTSLEVFPASQLIKYIPDSSLKYNINTDIQMAVSLSGFESFIETAGTGIIKFYDVIKKMFPNVEIEMHEYLKQYQEEVPEWLINYKSGDDFSFDDVIRERLAYYPGFGYDGTMLTVGNKSHAVHSFVHSDYMNTRQNIERQINHVRGYHVIGRKEWNIEEVLPLPAEGTNYRYAYDEMIRRAGDWIKRWTDDTPYLITHILERDPERDEEYGATRLAITTSNIDGFILYLLLFMEKCKKAPWLFLLQDHGMGGNHNRFGKGGWMEYSMKAAGKWPRFVISDNRCGTQIWDGYKKIKEAHPVIGGMHHNVRFLWKYNPINDFSNCNPFDTERTTALTNLDSLFEECARLLIEKPVFTTADIQRRFNIGYNRAGRLMEHLEEKGVISRIDSNRSRKVLLSKDELEDLLKKLKSNHG